MPTDALLARFLDALSPLAPVAVWAHGSLAAGDYVEGRSDLDLIAVLDDPVGVRTTWRLASLHARLRGTPFADRLHCTYLTPGTAEGAGRRHLTWAHERLFTRPVTPVTRTELHTVGRVLHGAPPAGTLPEVPAGELAAFVLRDQRDYWRREVDRAANWPQDIWVDLGLLTFARSTVTLRGSRGDHEADGSLKQGACAACGDGPYWTYPISPCARLFPAPCGARPSAGSGLESSG